MPMAFPAEGASQNNASGPIEIGPDQRLSVEAVEAVANDPTRGIQLSSDAILAMERSYQVFEGARHAGLPIYGSTTGFGPLVAFASADGGTGEYLHGKGLLEHLAAGWGPTETPWVAPEIVCATMLIRAQNLAQGYSGIRPRVLEWYLQSLQNDLVPCIPPIGSVGASGDLVPLAHIARALTGADGALVWFRGKQIPAITALALADHPAISLTGREALSLSNGTSFLTAYAALSVGRAARLIGHAERLTGWAYRLLGARASALDPRLHEARGHVGQMLSARNIAAEASANGDWEDCTRDLQEVYSLRCAPQILGACRENLDFARRLTEIEINHVSDNPLFFGEALPEWQLPVAHGGNFQGQQIGFAADTLNAALTQTAVLAERQLDVLVTPSPANDHAPLLLAWEPGATSGLAGAQLTATAIVAEMRAATQSHATMSIPTNGRNQDIVSMGALAARRCYEQTERLSVVLAILTLAIHQLTFLRQAGKAKGRIVPAPAWAPVVEGIQEDRALLGDIRRIAVFYEGMPG